MSVDYDLVFVVALVMFLVGIWATVGIVFLDSSDGEIILGDTFVRVDAEQEDWCEVSGCSEWVESYEWQPCGFKECYLRVRECISPYFIRRAC